MRPYLLAKATQFAKLVGNGHALEILVVPDGLEISANEQKVDFVAIAGFKIGQMRVDGIKFAVAAAFDSNLVEPSVV